MKTRPIGIQKDRRSEHDKFSLLNMKKINLHVRIAVTRTTTIDGLAVTQVATTIEREDCEPTEIPGKGMSGIALDMPNRSRVADTDNISDRFLRTITWIYCCPMFPLESRFSAAFLWLCSQLFLRNKRTFSSDSPHNWFAILSQFAALISILRPLILIPMLLPLCLSSFGWTQNAVTYQYSSRSLSDLWVSHKAIRRRVENRCHRVPEEWCDDILLFTGFLRAVVSSLGSNAGFEWMIIPTHTKSVTDRNAGYNTTFRI